MNRFRTGEVDLLIPVSITPERAALGLFTTPFYVAYCGVIAEKNSQIAIDGTERLARYRVGVIKVSAIVPFIGAIVPAAQIRSYGYPTDLYRG